MFKKITLKDKYLYYKYIDKNKFLSCEYSFATLFMWKEFNNIEYDILNNIFIIKKYDNNNGYFFMEPLGEIDDSGLINLINNLELIRKEEERKWLFGDVSIRFLNRLKGIYKEDLIFEEEKNNFDYVYDFNDLINLSGRKFRKKRNKYNQFIKNYNYKTEFFKSFLDNKEKKECLEFLDKWYLENKQKDDEFLAEINGTRNLINYLEELDLDLIKLYVDNKLIGISIGERFNDSTYIVHVEKCLKEFNGAYAFINNSLLKNSFLDLKYVNREEDLGVLGLRKSKMSYNPKFLERKYLVKIK
ncbi:phosphatidylglycerol lysyltransferase domain-containing protein [Clostridium perfringens]|nr:phosphatidylglycerol lysyltransferase domain-containing protein [Clostridium perfringens]MDM0476720.1 phosphatidylglycerol lysyltransferase domain-containing protein [Clostridium perfringens]MDM0479970.1 phosphatidylglycerol lysyltransferase domain-containing protein [Clostridium perfringens]MDM0485139.1 phosphatidylglycerol lysyltransferase domain-containing protein [Clostridium perfringens]